MFNAFVKGDFVDGSALVIRKEDGFFVYELEFEDGSILRLQYLFTDRFYSGYAVIDTGEGMGYINRMGVEVVPPVFNLVTQFSEERAFLCSNEHTVLIDCNFKSLAFFEPFLVTHNFNKGTALLSRITNSAETTEEALIDREGNIVAGFTQGRNINSVNDILTEVPPVTFHEGIEYFIKDGCRAVRDLYGNELVEDVPNFI